MPASQRRVGAYAKLLANYASDDAIIAAGEKAELLFVRALAFCATSDSDGWFSDAQLTRIVAAGMRDAASRARTLVRVGLWERTDGGYQVRSWTTIHETAEQKGRRLKADRERKRTDAQLPLGTASGIQSESGRNPPGLQKQGSPDSLSLIHDTTRQEHNSAPSLPAPRTEVAIARADDAAALIVDEWIDRCTKRPPKTVTGAVHAVVRGLVSDGIERDDIRRGLETWQAKGLHPTVLPSVVNEVMNARPPTRANAARPSGGNDAHITRAAQRLGVAP